METFTQPLSNHPGIQYDSVHTQSFHLVFIESLRQAWRRRNPGKHQNPAARAQLSMISTKKSSWSRWASLGAWVDRLT